MIDTFKNAIASANKRPKVVKVSLELLSQLKKAGLIKTKPGVIGGVLLGLEFPHYEDIILYYDPLLQLDDIDFLLPQG